MIRPADMLRRRAAALVRHGGMAALWGALALGHLSAGSPRLETAGAGFAASGRSERRSTLGVIGARAEEQTRYGFQLAEKGAVYSAEARFVQTLRLIAGSLDARSQSPVHTTALAAGLKALQEADEFATGDLPAGVPNLAAIVAGHSTPVLKQAPLERLSPLIALQEYYRFAEQQLAIAGGREPEASMALYGLGRVQLVPSAGGERTLAAPKAMALHRAALAVDSDNHLSANELGVLLARFGQYHEARSQFERSLAINNSAEARHNLDRVRNMLGQADAALVARQTDRTGDAAARIAESRVPAAATPDIRWVQRSEFDDAAACDPVTAPGGRGVAANRGVVPAGGEETAAAAGVAPAGGSREPLKMIRESLARFRDGFSRSERR